MLPQWKLRFLQFRESSDERRGLARSASRKWRGGGARLTNSRYINGHYGKYLENRRYAGASRVSTIPESRPMMFASGLQDAQAHCKCNAESRFAGHR